MPAEYSNGPPSGVSQLVVSRWLADSKLHLLTTHILTTHLLTTHILTWHLATRPRSATARPIVRSFARHATGSGRNPIGVHHPVRPRRGSPMQATRVRSGSPRRLPRSTAPRRSRRCWNACRRHRHRLTKWFAIANCLQRRSSRFCWSSSWPVASSGIRAIASH